MAIFFTPWKKANVHCPTAFGVTCLVKGRMATFAIFKAKTAAQKSMVENTGEQNKEN